MYIHIGAAIKRTLREQANFIFERRGDSRPWHLLPFWLETAFDTISPAHQPCNCVCGFLLVVVQRVTGTPRIEDDPPRSEDDPSTFFFFDNHTALLMHESRAFGSNAKSVGLMRASGTRLRTRLRSPAKQDYSTGRDSTRQDPIALLPPRMPSSARTKNIFTAPKVINKQTKKNKAIENPSWLLLSTHPCPPLTASPTIPLPPPQEEGERRDRNTHRTRDRNRDTNKCSNRCGHSEQHRNSDGKRDNA